MDKHCKILATIGPSSQSIDKLEAMVRAGVNLFRLNFSHGNYEYHKEVLSNIKEVQRRTGRFIGILQDISGPKVRIGKLKSEVILKPGDIIEFVKDDVIGDFISPNHLQVSLNYPELLDKLNIGDDIYLYDGTIYTRVKEILKDSIIAEVIDGGRLTSKKGVNFPNTHLDMEVLTQKDKKDIAWGVENGVDFMAISFVQSANDMKKVRQYLKSLGGTQDLIAKIEKFDAVEDIDEILKVSDGIMVARGDLGIEIPYYRVPEVQKMLIKKANSASKPVITATQMLLSMTHSERATRAEISDVANAVLDGSDCLMLSEESAIGKYPIEAVKTMSITIKEAEKEFNYFKIHQFAYNDDGDVINESAVNLVQNIEATAILAITTSGGSAKKLSRYRPKQPIYAVSHTEAIARKLTLVWGVLPLFISTTSSARKMMIDVISRGLDSGILSIDKNYIVTAGDPPGKPGSTNIIRILRRKELEHFSTMAKEQGLPEDWE